MTIPKNIIEFVLGLPFSNSWEFRGPFLELKAYIEDEGYFCTTRGCHEGDLKVLQEDDMSFESEKIRKRLARKEKKTVNTMISADISRLGEMEKSRHELSILKLTLTIQAKNSILNDL
jgi:hypothetical protein